MNAGVPSGLSLGLPPGLPSMPPRGITWPMVGYVFVRELPNTLAVVVGGIVAVVLVVHAPSDALKPLIAAIAPIITVALQRSKPTDPIDISRLSGS